MPEEGLQDPLHPNEAERAPDDGRVLLFLGPVRKVVGPPLIQSSHSEFPERVLNDDLTSTPYSNTPEVGLLPPHVVPQSLTFTCRRMEARGLRT